MNDEEPPDEERSEQVSRALLKGLAVVVVVGVLIALGTTIVVRALGLDDGGTAGPVGSGSGTGSVQPTKPLPTTALPVPSESAEQPSDEPTDLVTPDQAKGGRIELSVSPLKVKPHQRINLTGTYEGADNVELEVQRFQDGEWHDFGVQATVRVGTYKTYILTGRTGENRFRMFDPRSGRGSNVVLVQIG